jgi:hypothetical protein
VQTFDASCNWIRHALLLVEFTIESSLNLFVCWKHVTILVTDLVPMVGRHLGWRLPRLLVDQFSGLCTSTGLQPSYVVGEFMQRALTVGDVEETPA